MPRDRTRDHAELDEIRSAVDCAVVVEAAGYLLDKPGSTRNARKYRRGQAEIIVVTHGGKGWFDPLGSGDGQKGDCFDLVRKLHACSFKEAVERLRPLAGVAPTYQPAPKGLKEPKPFDAADWERARRLAPGTAGWRYLTETRALPPDLVARVVARGCLREGVMGTCWARHRDPATGDVVGWEMRGSGYKGYSTGGRKVLFVTGEPGFFIRRLVVGEAFIDVLSFAALHGGFEPNTLYVSTGGGYGEHGQAALARFLSAGRELVAATDRGTGGDLLAARFEALAKERGATFRRVLPRLKDFNEDLAAKGSRAA